MTMTTAFEPSWPAALRRGLGRALRFKDALILACAAVPRLFIGYTDHGMIWGDEIFQSLEPAHRLAFGYGITVWEFRDGARSWLFPAVLSAVMKIGAFFGAQTGLAVVGVTKTFMVALGLFGIFAAMRLARRFGGDTAALLAGVLNAAFPPALVFGSRAMGETASGTLVVVAAWLVSDHRDRAWLAGVVAATAIYLRYQNGILAVALLFLLLARRRFQRAAWYALSAGVVGLLGGALDYFTWGRFFHSFRVYWQFNAVEGNAARWGTSPWDFYLSVARSAAGPLIFVVALGLLFAIRRVPGLVMVAAVFVAAHSLVPHKEFRFVMPIVPLALALSGVGLGSLVDRLDRRRVLGFGLAAVIASAWLVRTRRMTLGEMGQFEDAPTWRSVPPWNFFGGVNRAMAEAGMQKDVCGLAIFGIAPWWMGGFGYLHRNVPLFVGESAAAVASSNYVIIPLGTSMPAGYGLVGEFREYVLLHRGGRCAPRPADYRHPLE